MTDFAVNFIGRDSSLTATASKSTKALKGTTAAASSAREDLKALGATLTGVFTTAGRTEVLKELNSQFMLLSDNIIEFGGSAKDVSDTMLMIGQRAARTSESVALLTNAARTLVDEADDGTAALRHLGTALDLASAASIKTEDAGRILGRTVRGEVDALNALGGEAARLAQVYARLPDASERARLGLELVNKAAEQGMMSLTNLGAALDVVQRKGVMLEAKTLQSGLPQLAEEANRSTKALGLFGEQGRRVAEAIERLPDVSQRAAVAQEMHNRALTQGQASLSSMGPALEAVLQKSAALDLRVARTGLDALHASSERTLGSLRRFGPMASNTAAAIAKINDPVKRAEVANAALNHRLKTGTPAVERLADKYNVLNARLSVMTGMANPLQTLGVAALGAATPLGMVAAAAKLMGGAVLAAGAAVVGLGVALAGVAVKALRAYAATSASATAASERLSRAQDQVWVSMGRAMLGASDATGVLEQLTATTYRLDAAVTRNSESIRTAFEVVIKGATVAVIGALGSLGVMIMSVTVPIDALRAAFYSAEGSIYRVNRAIGKQIAAIAPAGSALREHGENVARQSNELLSAMGSFESYTEKVNDTIYGLQRFADETQQAMLSTQDATAANVVAINVLEKLAVSANKAAMAQSGVAVTNPAGDLNKSALGAQKKAKAWRPRGGGGRRAKKKPPPTLGQRAGMLTDQGVDQGFHVDFMGRQQDMAAMGSMAAGMSASLDEVLAKTSGVVAEMQRLHAEGLQTAEWQRYGDAASDAIMAIVDSTYRLLDAMAMGNLALNGLRVAAADMGGDMLANLGLDMMSEAMGVFAIKIGAVFEGLGAAFSALTSNPIALLGIGAGLVAAGLLLKKFRGSGTLSKPSSSSANRADSSAANAVQALGRQLFESEDRRSREVYLMLDDRTGLRGYIGSTVGDMQTRGGTGF